MVPLFRKNPFDKNQKTLGIPPFQKLLTLAVFSSSARSMNTSEGNVDEAVSASVGFVCRECMVVLFFFLLYYLVWEKHDSTVMVAVE